MKAMTKTGIDGEANQAGKKLTKRREFLDYLLGTGVGATLVAIFYPVMKFVIPPQVTEATQNSVIAGKVSDMVANSGKIFKFGNKPGILVRTASGEPCRR